METDGRIPLVEEILGVWAEALGEDRLAYSNHVHRMVHFCLALHGGSAQDREKVEIAGAFHDLGIWARGTFDYLEPSIALARDYLAGRGLDAWAPEIERMIALHHKLRPVRGDGQALVEAFRRADLVDLSLGVVRYGLPEIDVAEVRRRFPNAGFHRALLRHAGGWLRRHPLNPVPVLRW